MLHFEISKANLESFQRFATISGEKYYNMIILASFEVSKEKPC